METPDFSKKEQKFNYEYFDSARKRRDIYEFCKGVSTYLHDEKIPSIVMLDRSPRPLWIGIDEYYKEHYKNEKRPNIYFVNPIPFDTIAKVKRDGKMSFEDLIFDQMMFAATGESILIKKAEEYDEKNKAQFEQAYKELEKNKEKPVALFDNCLHSGETMIPVIDYLLKHGYQDVRVVIGETSNNTSPLQVDKTFTDKVHYTACGAFGNDFGVKKDNDNVFSKFDERADMEEVIKSRKEIRQIVRDKGI